MSLIKEYKVDKLTVKSYDTRRNMGDAAAKEAAAAIKALLCQKEEINIIFAAAPSQNELLAAFVADATIPWNRINAFHMDEYIGLPADAPQGFGNFLKKSIFGRLPFKSVNYLDGGCTDYSAECRRYSALLEKYPVDVVCLGIGENGHIAFNDPPVADFNDPYLVKVVTLDSICRNQQVHDGCFDKIEEVPTQALTLTIPALLRGKHLFCVVPAATKANAVSKMLTGEIAGSCPASILRRHNNAALYLDSESSKSITIG